MPLYLILLFIIESLPVVLGTTKPTVSYHPPLNIPLILSANFGELRPNHFHMGLDFKTEAREGLTLHAIDKGYISRVNISPYGYGRTVYINHPNGITSVYAHCQRLTGKLEEKVKEIQTKTQNSEADIYFQPNEMKMEWGEIFALSGNSGASQGPHLHFEIRDTYTEEAINPLLFGFKIADTKSPNTISIKIYALDEFGYLKDGKEKEWSIKNNTLGNGLVSIPANFSSPKGGVGFAINAIDKFDGAYNSCGLYGSRVIVDGDTLMEQELSKVAFEHTRYFNAYTDYHAFKVGKKYHKSFHSVLNPLTVYKKKTNGILKIKPGNSYRVQYDVYDFSGNSTTTFFTLGVLEGEMDFQESKINDLSFINPIKPLKIEHENGKIEVPIACTFEPIPKRISWTGNSFLFLSDTWPVQEAYTISMKILPNISPQKQYLSVQHNGASNSLPTHYSKGWLEAKSKYFGEIRVQIDDKPPGIVAKNIKPILYKSKTKRMVWNIGDYQSGLANYGIVIDGVWHVLDYDSKGDFGFIEINDLTIGVHDLIVVATDFSGNKREEKFIVEIKN